MGLASADFVLPVPLQPKARPRFGNGMAYKDSRYKAWTSNVRSILREWWTAPPLEKGRDTLWDHERVDGPLVDPLALPEGRPPASRGGKWGGRALGFGSPITHEP
jgi:hypothetical protein